MCLIITGESCQDKNKEINPFHNSNHKQFNTSLQIAWLSEKLPIAGVILTGNKKVETGCNSRINNYPGNFLYHVLAGPC